MWFYKGVAVYVVKQLNNPDLNLKENDRNNEQSTKRQLFKP
jgi:hypothetical protein